jgi:uncharacterized membrane protein
MNANIHTIRKIYHFSNERGKVSVCLVPLCQTTSIILHAGQYYPEIAYHFFCFRCLGILFGGMIGLILAISQYRMELLWSVFLMIPLVIDGFHKHCITVTQIMH